MKPELDQPVQHNARSRPSSGASPAFQAPSAPAHVADLGTVGRMFMKIAALLPLLFSAFGLTGCAGTSLVSITPDPVTGKMTRKTYTKFYDAGVWLVPEHLGMSVVIDQLDEYSGKLTIYAWNRDPEKHVLRILNISSGLEKVVIGNNEIVAIGYERTGLEIGKIRVLNYGTSIDLDVVYQLDGVDGKASLRLERRTPEELRRYFGRDGVPPYPWYHDQ